MCAVSCRECTLIERLLLENSKNDPNIGVLSNIQAIALTSLFNGSDIGAGDSTELAGLVMRVPWASPTDAQMVLGAIASTCERELTMAGRRSDVGYMISLTCQTLVQPKITHKKCIFGGMGGRLPLVKVKFLWWGPRSQFN